MYDPVSTYRIQFHKGFNFRDFEEIIPYLAKLGIKTIYASPIFEAMPGSMHGYDVTDSLKINPEIGTLRQLRSISRKLKKLNMGWLQDIVPNHMAFHSSNKWLMDVLENGRNSLYADFFDINWESPVHGGKLMVPFLGKPLEKVLAQRELKVVWDKKPFFDYFGQRYPLNRQSQERFLNIDPDKSNSQRSFVKRVNNDANLLVRLLDEQYYILCYWQETDKEINFRRFFTVNSLICLNMQHEKVFEHYHRLIGQLTEEGVFQGLRIDHIDGLYDPETYLKRLRSLVEPETYIITEKILEEGEEFPPGWPVEGNTGYDFLAVMNNLFTFNQSRKVFSEFYKGISPEPASVKSQIFQKKQMILNDHMQGELDNLCRLFIDSKLADNVEADYMGADVLKKAIAELLVHCPVYRFYGNSMPLPEKEAAALEQLLKAVSTADPSLAGVNNVLENCLLLKPKVESAEYRQRALHFYLRMMQFTGPLMAKGVEDTLMYTYNRFIGHNEVGDSPASFGIPADDFHQMMLERRNLWPLSLNASSTHDTKRGEDVRSRLNVLSDISESWIKYVKRWQKMNGTLKTNSVPDANDEYFIYQTLAGAYPMPGDIHDDFKSRIKEYIIKALRESKRNSSWALPNEQYEDASQKFIDRLLDRNNPFITSFEEFSKEINDFGIINSLAQVLLKCTCPGIPDFYRGCELWDLNLVDPDNRRPVDYVLRQNLLKDDKKWPELWENRYCGHIKIALIATFLKIRSDDPETFTSGEYIPLRIKGKYKNNLLSFARHFNDRWYLIAIPLHFARIAKSGDKYCSFDWKDTRIVVPDGAPLAWENLLTQKAGYSPENIPVNELFTKLPLALLQLKASKQSRMAGILLHITSLPSAFGMGDIGPQAFHFADFLYQGRQKYWQMLPVNPIDAGTGYSPYSSTSAMAGNVLLISPELLVNDGLLDEHDLQECRIENNGPADFNRAMQVRKQLFSRAFNKFAEIGNRSSFDRFKRSEAWWLNDFALYQYLKDRYHDKPWHEWPAKYRTRDKRSLEAIAGDAEIDKIKWLQFVFAGQWANLKQYCNTKEINLIGDMPFYISYDSADVWANPEIFKIDRNGRIIGIAGVPPDYFSETGQLWGMPVYDWDALTKSGYDWWLKRIKRNLRFFDLIRMDHFRAFSEYWEVPHDNENAINGTWKPGPGADFFEKVKKNIGYLPFLAEDLGLIDEKVYRLRDQFGLPGMRVLQFAFDKTMPVSEYIPHNYNLNSLVYTGTHDNNTTRGWYANDISSEDRKRLSRYTGVKANAKNISKIMIRLAYASVAKTAIIPMQDILNFDESARMNIPSSSGNNWTWRLASLMPASDLSSYLRKLTIEYNR